MLCPSARASLRLRRSLPSLVLVAAFALPQAACQPKADAPKPAAAAPAAQEWTKKFAASGLQGDAATPPGQLPQTAAAAAKTGELDALVKGLLGPTKLRQQQANRRRRQPVLSTAALWESIQAGKAEPVHAVEAAWLVWGLAQLRGEAAEFVTDAAGVQTPLMLTRTRLGVRVAGKVIEPFGDSPMKQPTVVPTTKAAAWWLVVRAGAARMRGAFPEAYADLLAAETLHTPLGAALFARGVTELEQQIKDKGLPSCEAALAVEDDPLARLFLAEFSLAQEAPVQALQHVQAALKVAPDLPEALVTQGLVQMQRLQTLPESQKTDLTKEIEATLEKALQLNPRVPGAHAARANLKILARDIDSAEKILNAALANKGPAGEVDLESTLLLASILSQKNDNAGALKILEAAAAPLDDERFALALARTHAKLGAIDKALDVAEKAYAAAPDNHNLGLLRADLLRQSGKVPEAIAALEALKKGPDAERVTLLQAQLYAQGGQFNKALPMLTEARKAKPDNKDAAALLLVTLAMAKQTDQSLALADELLKSGLLQSQDIAGLYLQIGAMDVAGMFLQKSIEAGAKDPESWALYAMVLTAGGKKADALALKKKAQKDFAPDAAKQLLETIDKAIAAAEAEMRQMQEQLEAMRKAAPEGAGGGHGPHDGHDHGGHEGHDHAH